jgi:hypothetical protein
MCYAGGTQVRPTSRAVFHVRGSKLGSNEVHQMARWDVIRLRGMNAAANPSARLSAAVNKHPPEWRG